MSERLALQIFLLKVKGNSAGFGFFFPCTVRKKSPRVKFGFVAHHRGDTLESERLRRGWWHVQALGSKAKFSPTLVIGDAGWIPSVCDLLYHSENREGTGGWLLRLYFQSLTRMGGRERWLTADLSWLHPIAARSEFPKHKLNERSKNLLTSGWIARLEWYWPRVIILKRAKGWGVQENSQCPQWGQRRKEGYGSPAPHNVPVWAESSQAVCSWHWSNSLISFWLPPRQNDMFPTGCLKDLKTCLLVQIVKWSLASDLTGKFQPLPCPKHIVSMVGTLLQLELILSEPSCSSKSWFKNTHLGRVSIDMVSANLFFCHCHWCSF